MFYVWGVRLWVVVSVAVILPSCQVADSEEEVLKAVLQPTTLSPIATDPIEDEGVLDVGKDVVEHIISVIDPQRKASFDGIIAASTVSEGTLIITPDALNAALDNAKTVKTNKNSQDVILGQDGHFSVYGLSTSTGVQMTYLDNEGRSFSLEDLYYDGSTQHLGVLNLHQQRVDVRLRIHGEEESYILVVPDSNIHQTLTSQTEHVVALSPGGHLMSLVKADGSLELLATQYVFVNKDVGDNVIQLMEGGEFTISGQVTDENNRALSGVKIYVKDSDQVYSFSRTDQAGFFHLKHVSAGQYSVVFEKDGYNAAAYKEVEVSDDVTLKNIRLIPTNSVGSISGYAHFQGARSHGGMDITVESVDGRTDTRQNGTLSDGAFLINNLPPGSYNLLFGKEQDSTYHAHKVENIQVVIGNNHELFQPVRLKPIDENPPLIQGVEQSALFETDNRGTLLLNPSAALLPNRVDFVVTASDADGDKLSYHYVASVGEIVAIDGNAFSWIAPTQGGMATVWITVRSQYREVRVAKQIKINYRPTITVSFPDEAVLQDDEKLLSQFSTDAVNLRLAVSDFEDGELPTEHIVWQSDLQGRLGFGQYFNGTLIPGKHAILISATDYHGNVSRKRLYLNITAPDQLVLKAPTVGLMKYAGKLLSDRQTLPFKNPLEHVFSSNRPDIVAVDESGTLQAVSSGVAVISLQSEALNQHGHAAYQANIVVRVIDQWMNTAEPASLSVNQMVEVRVKSGQSQTLHFPALDVGHYEVMLFDKQDIVPSSRLRANLTKNDVAVSTTVEIDGESNRILELKVPVHAEDYVLNLAARSTGDALLKVGLFPGVDTYNDQGELRQQTFWDAHYEPNEINATAFPLRLGQTYNAALNQQDTQDKYAFEVLSGETYIVVVRNHALSQVAIRREVEGDGVTLLKAEYLQNNSTDYQTIKSHFSGQARLNLSNQSAQFAHYSVQVIHAGNTELKRDPLTLEPNDVDAIAVPMTINSRLRSSADGVADSDDVYVFEAQAYTPYVVMAQPHSSLQHKVEMRIHDGDGNEVFRQWSQYPTMIAELKPVINGRYYVHLHAVDASKKSDYTLAVYSPLEENFWQDGSSFEPNDSDILAVPINTLQKTWVSTLNGHDDNVDVYTFMAQPEVVYTLNSRRLSGQGSLLANIYGDGVKIDRLSVGDEFHQTLTTLSETPIYIKLFGEKLSRDAVIHYSLAIFPDNNHGLVQDEVSFEPNNTAAMATKIELNTPFSSEVTGLEDNLDVLAIAVEAGQSYQLTVTRTGGTASGFVCMPNGSGVDNRGAIACPETSILQPNRDGDVYITLRARYFGYRKAWENNQSLRYTVQVSLL